MGIIETINWDLVVDHGLWVLAWLGLILLGVLPLSWAIQQRLFGGLSTAMGHLKFKEKSGRPCERKQCFINQLEAHEETAERALKSRIVYTGGYISAVLAPGAALILYAVFQNYLAPFAAPAFVSVVGGDTSGATWIEVLTHFLVTSNFFVVLGDDLVADLPLLAGIAEFLPTTHLQLNSDAALYSSLVTAFKWASGPALLFSGIVITQIWGGFAQVRRLIDRLGVARTKVAAMSIDEEGTPAEERQQKIRRVINKVMTAQDGTG